MDKITVNGGKQIIMGELNRFLFIDDDENMIILFKTLLIKYVPQNNYQIDLAFSAEDALEKYRNNKYDIVFTDLQMPQKNGFELIKDIKVINPAAFVVVITGYGSEDIAVESLKQGAISYLKKPVRIEDLKECISRIENLNKLSQKSILSSSRNYDQYIDRSIINYKLPNIIYYELTDFINSVLFPYEAILSNIVNIKMGLFEILVNAIEHGNLGITSEQKEYLLSSSKWEDEFRILIQSPLARQTFITVEITLEKNQLSITVEDQGNGFDVSRVSEKLENAQPSTSLSGRGIIMTKYYFDRVVYNNKGNSVTITKAIQS